MVKKKGILKAGQSCSVAFVTGTSTEKYSKAAALGAGLRLLDIVAGPKPSPGRDLRPGWAWPGSAHGLKPSYAHHYLRDEEIDEKKG